MRFIDFETDGIESRPNYPPEPRGVAMQEGSRSSYVREFGQLRKVWNTGPMCFHNAPFDIAVGVEKLGLPMPDWRNIHDTQILAFLDNPYAPSLKLKDLAATRLGMPPDEQADVRDWVMANVPEAKRKKVNWGYWIAKAPMELLRPYAKGDNLRTKALFESYKEYHNSPAYERERRLIPLLLDNSRRGIRVDLAQLRKDVPKYEKALVETDRRICTLLGYNFNVDSGEELADALEASGKGSGFLVTATGKRSVSKQSLAQAQIDPAVAELLNYRGRLDTALSMNLRTWLETAELTGGTIHIEWASTRSDSGGARTGRLASSPNIQNISKEFSAVAPKGLPPLPHMRNYLLPDPGHVWVRRDFSQQELRVLAHYAEGKLLEMYQDDPTLDLHQTVADMMGVSRKVTKGLSFGIIYGMGIKSLSERLGITPNEARDAYNKYMKLLPGLRELKRDVESKGRRGEYMRTWGGRRFTAKPPAMVKGQYREFAYVCLNFLIQGGSADITKQAMLNCAEAVPIELARPLCSIHDELCWSVPNNKRLKKTVKELGDAMCDIDLDVKLLSDVEVGKSWGEVVEYAE